MGAIVGLFVVLTRRRMPIEDNFTGRCKRWKRSSRYWSSAPRRTPTAGWRLKYVEGACGLAVEVGGRVTSVDLFDKQATCRKVWDRLLTGPIMDALEACPAASSVGGDEVLATLATLRNAPWKESPAVGVGEEFRADLEGDRHASALAYGGSVVHGSLVAAG